MLLIEFTSTQKDLNNILRGICINSDNKLLNDSCKDIIARDIINLKPSTLIHCYTKKELVGVLSHLMSNGMCEMVAKEIIPNTYDMGIIRELMLGADVVKSLDTIICKRFRYYFILEQKVGKVTEQVCVTFNPEVRNLKQINLKLDDDTIVHCSTLQSGKIEKILREVEVEKSMEMPKGVYTVYKL